MISSNTSKALIKNSRISFVISYTITLFTAGFLLITALVAIQAQDASPLTGTRRIPLSSGSVTTSDSKSKSASPVTIQQRTSLIEDNPVQQVPEVKKADNDQKLSEHNVAHSTDNDEIAAEQLKSTTSVAPAPDTGTRQTRATTRKHSTSTTLGSDTETTTAIQPISSSSPATDNVSTELESDDVERDRLIRKKSKKKKQEAEEEDEEDDDDEAERERARKKKLKLARKNNATTTAPESPSSTSQLSSGVVTKLATAKQAPQPTTGTVASLGEIQVSSPAPKIPTTVRKHRPSDSATATSPTVRQKTHHRHKHPIEDDDLDETKGITKRPLPDFSKVKLVGANHSIDNSTKSNINTAPTIISTQAPDISSLHSASTASTTSDWNISTPGTVSKHSMLAEPLTLPTISRSSNDTNSTHHEDLDSRSPVSQSTNLGKRLTTIIADTRNKLLKQSTSQPTTTATSRFAYSKPYSTTTMMTPLVQTKPTTESTYVQFINQSDPSQAVRFENTTEQLDWSKLVKVVFKSAKDNHTVYTVVMNSSELSNHPINDWSNELPNLLKNDFEKLISKWSNVFPVHHLMADLGKIIIEKVSVVSNTSTPTHVIAQLNESLALAKPIDHPSNLTTAVIQKIANKNISVSPSSPNLNFSNPIQNNRIVLHSNATNNTSQNLSIQKILNDTPLHRNSTKSHFDIKKSHPDGFKYDSNSNMTLSSPKPMDQARSTTPWSSSSLRDLGGPLATGGQKQAVPPSNSQVERTNSNDPKNYPRNTTGLQNPLSNSTSLDEANKGNRSLIDLMKDVNEEHSKLENNVKEQGDSLRHFIVICSVAVVVATSLIVALVVLLTR